MAARSAARKKTSTRKTSARGRARRSGPLGRIEGQLPPTLRDFSSDLRKRLDRLERDLTRAQVEARRSAARLLREASVQLGRLEVAGEAGWRKLGASYQKDLVALLKRIEKAVAPRAARKRPRKKVTRAKARPAAPPAE